MVGLCIVMCVGTILSCAVCCGCVMRSVWQIIRRDVVWCAARIHVHVMCVKVFVQYDVVCDKNG